MIELVLYHTFHKVRGGFESAQRVAFIKKGKKWIQVLAIDASSSGGMKMWKEPIAHEANMKPLLYKGKPYPVNRALKVFRKVGKTHGITKSAKAFLKEAGRENKTKQNTGGEDATSSPGNNA